VKNTDAEFGKCIHIKILRDLKGLIQQVQRSDFVPYDMPYRLDYWHTTANLPYQTRKKRFSIGYWYWLCLGRCHEGFGRRGTDTRRIRILQGISHGKTYERAKICQIY